MLFRLSCLLPLLFCLLYAGPLPEGLEAALAQFRTEGAFGWGFTQTSVDENETLVERYDPAPAAPLRWTLLSHNGQVPDEEERRKYRQGKLLRTSALNAPRLEKQLDLDSCEVLEATDTQLRCRFKLKAGESHDEAWQHLQVTLELERSKHCITRVTIETKAPFSPVIGVQIEASRTELNYSLPEHGRPSFLLEAKLSLKGRRLWLIPFSQTLTISYSEHFSAHAADRK